MRPPLLREGFCPGLLGLSPEPRGHGQAAETHRPCSPGPGLESPRPPQHSSLASGLPRSALLLLGPRVSLRPHRDAHPPGLDPAAHQGQDSALDTGFGTQERHAIQPDGLQNLWVRPRREYGKTLHFFIVKGLEVFFLFFFPSF